MSHQPRMEHGSNTDSNPCLVRVPSVAENSDFVLRISDFETTDMGRGWGREIYGFSGCVWRLKMMGSNGSAGVVGFAEVGGTPANSVGCFGAEGERGGTVTELGEDGASKTDVGRSVRPFPSADPPSSIFDPRSSP